MKLELYRTDLKHAHRDVNCSLVDFKHLRAEAQAAVRAVGKGTFYDDGRESYNVVYAPAETEGAAAARRTRPTRARRPSARTTRRTRRVRP
jgi:hypothetical protein